MVRTDLIDEVQMALTEPREIKACKMPDKEYARPYSVYKDYDRVYYVIAGTGALRSLSRKEKLINDAKDALQAVSNKPRTRITPSMYIVYANSEKVYYCLTGSDILRSRPTDSFVKNKFKGIVKVLSTKYFKERND